jgi:hypothetical protein
MVFAESILKHTPITQLTHSSSHHRQRITLYLLHTRHPATLTSRNHQAPEAWLQALKHYDYSSRFYDPEYRNSYNSLIDTISLLPRPPTTSASPHQSSPKHPYSLLADDLDQPEEDSGTAGEEEEHIQEEAEESTMRSGRKGQNLSELSAVKPNTQKTMIPKPPRKKHRNKLVIQDEDEDIPAAQTSAQIHTVGRQTVADQQSITRTLRSDLTSDVSPLGTTPLSEFPSLVTPAAPSVRETEAGSHRDYHKCHPP